jgi:hypothetical protein
MRGPASAAVMGWTPPVRGSKLPLVRDANHGPVTKGAHPMSNVTIAVDIAKNVFEIAVSAAAGRIQERRRMTRHQFERFWSTREPCRVVMEGLLGLALLGAAADRPRVRGEADPAPLRHAVPPAQQDRPRRLRGDPRGGPLRRNPRHHRQERGAAGDHDIAPRALAVDGHPLPRASTACAGCSGSSASPARWARSGSSRAAPGPGAQP